MKRYFIEKCEREFKLKGFEYSRFCTYGEGDIFNEKISPDFETKEEAIAELQKYESTIRRYPSNGLAYVTEYTVAVEDDEEDIYEWIEIAPLYQEDQEDDEDEEDEEE